ncbi:glycosyltransferase family 9 protein [Lewinella sp. W8]|uniref:glycosyltransferase family 9 protein n=1 Tax=Lewinella sp. W8 TaxID=2528208 RepID=UPI00106873C9|nr:glycosyltransferase family 9 protein [Lewinella sp. W8]MTB49409.1 glycosyl transferase [Lewinella sp. W8]
MPPKVLIIRFSSIGDIVLTTPVIRGVKQQAGAEVHFLTKASFAAVLKGNPHLDRVWTIKKDISEIAAELVRENYDYLIDLHGNLRSLEVKTRLLVHALRHLRPRPRTATFNKLNFRKFLLTRLGINRMPDLHIVDRYLAAAARLGVRKDGHGLDYFIASEDEVHPEEVGLPPHYLAFVIGAAHATKRLSEEQMATVCREFPAPVVLLGGPAEAALGERLAEGNDHVHNACGKFSLGGSADLVRQAQVVLTHDTGLMHIAAAFRKPIISVWGNTVPDLGMYPYLPGAEAEEKERRQEITGLSCRPCSKIGFQACPKGHFRCILDQSPADLVAAARALLPNALP